MLIVEITTLVLETISQSSLNALRYSVCPPNTGYNTKFGEEKSLFIIFEKVEDVDQ